MKGKEHSTPSKAAIPSRLAIPQQSGHGPPVNILAVHDFRNVFRSGHAKFRLDVHTGNTHRRSPLAPVPDILSSVFFFSTNPQDDTVTRRVTQVSMCGKLTPTNEKGASRTVHTSFVGPVPQLRGHTSVTFTGSTSIDMTEFASATPTQANPSYQSPTLKDMSNLWWA